MNPRRVVTARHTSIAILCSVLAIGCAGGGTDATTPPPQPAAVSSVGVAGPATVEVGEAAQMTATPKDGSGSILSGRTVTWLSSSPAVASVSETGLVTANATGSATISANIEGKTGSAAISSTPVAIATVEVAIVSSALVSGRTTQAEAVFKGSKGQVITGRVATWSTSSPSVASVSSTGVVTAATPGTASITASAEGKSGVAQVTVTLPPVAIVTVAPASGTLVAGNSGQVVATLQDANGTVLNRPIDNLGIK